VRLLAIFMVADRVDAPPGWRRNAPTVWFLEEARARGLIPALKLDLPEYPSTISAGGALVREHEGAHEVLLLRVRATGYELPKGGIEWDELPFAAAVRETREESGIESMLCAEDELGHLDYLLGEGADRHGKRVRYFRLRSEELLRFGPLPKGTRERRWVRREDVPSVPLVNEAMRPLLTAAFETPASLDSP
jgi:8-oxo-dGTP pyrophosphatase MutT (NUDIX family)